MVVCVVAVGPPAANAFVTPPHGRSPHQDMTEEAARALGWNDTATLVDAVRSVDEREMKYSPEHDAPDNFEANDEYRPEHHCDRVPPTGHVEAFEATAAYIQQQRRIILPAATSGHLDTAVEAVGWALHALQDCFSHSNAVDLPPASQESFKQSLLTGGPAPTGVRITGFMPGADDNGSPPGDDYGHTQFAKDDDDENDEAKAEVGNRTKYEVAYLLAADATARFLRQVREEVGSQTWAAMAEVEPEQPEHLLPSPVTVPVALAAAAAVRRRRTSRLG